MTKNVDQSIPSNLGGSGNNATYKKSRAGMAFVLSLLLTASLWMFAQTYIFGTFSVPSASMYPTIEIGDRIFVNKLSNDNIQRGDIVVFADDLDWLKQENTGFLVKRVVAVEGDRISCCAADGKILLNGEPLLESSSVQLDGVPFAEQTVPEGAVWVMGDNRVNSLDSRYQNPAFVSASSIVGKAAYRFWPFNEFKSLQEKE